MEPTKLVETVELAATNLGIKASLATCTSWEAEREIDLVLNSLEIEFKPHPSELLENPNSELRRRRGLIASAKAAKRLGRRVGFSSRSHANGVSVAIATTETPGIFGIGIDIEPADRQISYRLHERLRKRYGDFGGPDIELWCVLEAIFKSDPIQEPHGLFSYKLESGSFFKNDVEFSYETVRHDGLVVAIATSHALRSS